MSAAKEINGVDNNPSVCVLMSYYNGNKFLHEQLESIFNQDYEGKITILIRDDGSPKDRIDDVITKLEHKKKREILVYREDNVGVQRSFLNLIQEAQNAEYYFFADQDDIWLPHKIRKAVEEMLNVDDKYVMWCSNYSVVDQDINEINSSGVTISPRTYHFLRSVFFNTFPGCVMGFNQNTLQVLKDMHLDNCMMHDSVAFATVNALGTVIYNAEPSILHRIHASNVVGYGKSKIVIGKWIKEKFKLLFEKEPYDVSEFASKLIRVAGAEIKQDVYDDVKLLACYKRTLKDTLILWRHKDVRDTINRCSLSIHLKILLHLF